MDRAILLAYFIKLPPPPKLPTPQVYDREAFVFDELPNDEIERIAEKETVRIKK